MTTSNSFRCGIFALTVLGLLGTAEPVTAGVVYGFTGVSNNNAGDVVIGQTQLTVEVLDLGSNQVGFKFANAGPAASSITQIYFDDWSLLGISSIVNGPGTDYSQGASPPNLPAGNTINFNTTAGFLADPNPPVQPNGVNPGEWVQIVFDLINGETYQDTLDAIALSLANPGVDKPGGLRIGIHVQGYASSGSETFVNGPPTSVPPTPVPAPPGLALAGLAGLVGLAARRRLA